MDRMARPQRAPHGPLGQRLADLEQRRPGNAVAKALGAPEVLARRGTSCGKSEAMPATVAASAPPSRQPEFVDETPRRPRRSEAERMAEDELDHHWVTLLSIERPVPRHFGDNRGMLPIWVEANADWRQSGTTFDRQQPALRARRLAVLGVCSAAHASRLKAALDEALHGRETAHDADPLRHRFRNAVDFGDIDVWWTPLLQDALLQCELAATEFEVFTRADHERMVANRVAHKMYLVSEGR